MNNLEERKINVVEKGQKQPVKNQNHGEIVLPRLNKFSRSKLEVNSSTKISLGKNKLILPVNLIRSEKILSLAKSKSPDKENKSPERNLINKINIKHTNSKTLTAIHKDKIYNYVVLPGNNSELIRKCMESRQNWKESNSSQVTTLFHFKWQHISTGIDFTTLSKFANCTQIVNHMEFHPCISNKINLFLNLMKYCEKINLDVFNYMPFSIIVQYDSPSFVKQFQKFTEFYNFTNAKDYSNEYSLKNEKYADLFKLGIHNDKLGFKTNLFIPQSYNKGKNIWLIKAPDLNRGRCIKLAYSLEEIKTIIKSFNDGIFRDYKIVAEQEKLRKENAHNKDATNNINNKKNGKIVFDYRKYRSSCVILQKYLENPLLYLGRKFDIRIWVLYTHRDSVYAFKEGHLKTSSYTYDLNLSDNFIHLTNYSVQKYNKEFSKYEQGNEVSFKDFQNYLNSHFGENVYTINKDIFPKIKNLINLTFHSVKDKINMNKRKYCFELFGFDFIVDNYFNLYLLEVNTNPGLEESSPLIKILVPRMIEDTLRLTIDEIFSLTAKKEYKSAYPVDGYGDQENLWDLVTDFSDDSNIF